MITYNKANDIIDLIKEDIAAYTHDQYQAQNVYASIYNYLNHAGGHTIMPDELQAYTNVLTVFQNPKKIVNFLYNEDEADQYINEDTLQKEIQTIVLSWLEVAANTPAQNIDLHVIMNKCNTSFKH